METRRLGRTDLMVPPVCFGAWAIGGWGWGGGTDDGEAVRAIHAGIDAGMHAIDTAPVYGFGHSERLVGRALQGRREQVLIMTKVGLRWDDPGGSFFFESTRPDGGKARIHTNSRPESVRYEVERSLERLGVDCIDLVQVHWPDDTTPIADTMGALASLRAEGKLRAIGVSNYSTAMMKEAQSALGDVPLASDQPQYNLVTRDIERDVLPWTREHDVGVLVYSPLEQGLLTGRVPAERTFPADDGRAQRPTFRPQNRAKVNATVAEVVEPIAKRHGATAGQIVIAWTIAQPGVTAALVGARTAAQAQENAGAGELVLAPGELETIDRAFSDLRLDVPRRKKRIGDRVRGLIGRLRTR